MPNGTRDAVPMLLWFVHSGSCGPEEGAALVAARTRSEAIRIDMDDECGYSVGHSLGLDEIDATVLDWRRGVEESAHAIAIHDDAIRRRCGMWENECYAMCEKCELHPWESVPDSELCELCGNCGECGHDPFCDHAGLTGGQ